MIKQDVKYDKGILNADTTPELIGQGEHINMSDFRFGTTDKGFVEGLESVGSTVLKSAFAPSVSHVVVASVDDAVRNRILYLRHDLYTNNHDIRCYDAIADTDLLVLRSADVTGGLNFSKAVIDTLKVVNGSLTWVEGLNNEPRMINIDAALKMTNPSYSTTVKPYTSPLLYTDLTIIRRPPIYPIQATKKTDVTFSGNYTQNQAYQFTYRYHYKNYQISALAAYSPLVAYNTAADTFNYVTAALSFNEDIDDYVQSVDMCVKYGYTGKTVVIKTWDKDNAADAAAIIAHNSNTTALSFDFYDDLNGIVLDDVFSVNNFDAVPQYALTLELARDRIFLGDITAGYDTPSTTSLATTVTTTSTGGGGGDIAAVWGYIQLYANIAGSFSRTYVYDYPVAREDLGGGSFKYYYFPAVRSGNRPSWDTGPGVVPASINLSTVSFTSFTESAMATYLQASNFPDAPVQPPVSFPYWLTTPAPAPYTAFYTLGAVTISTFTPSSVNKFFKSGSTYFVSIAFFDRYRRKCGIVNKQIKSAIPERTFTQTSFSSAIQWTLDNTDALNEIPDWAYYYQIHITKNQTTRFFEQAYAVNSDYPLRNTDGTYSYGHSAYSVSSYAIAIDISAMFNFGYGYTFTEGDFIKIHLDATNNYVLPIIGQDGNWVLCKPDPIGPLDATTKIIFELYTPYKSSVTEPYYETGDVYAIVSPGTAGRSYSVLSGVINGDTYALERVRVDTTAYIVEAMSPNDKTYKLWQTDTGWVNFVDTIGKVEKQSTFVASDTFITGTKVNGLNKFQPLNSWNVGTEVGAISKLQLTSKTQEQPGTVMLAICNKETVSIYLGETQVVASATNTFIAQTTGIVGTMNTLKGSFGTRHPESVTQYRGLVFWWDDINAKIIQYSVNGLDAISDYRMTRFWKQFTDQFNSMSTAEIEALGGRPYVVTTVDPHHNELLITIPKLLSTPPKGYLLDYPSTPYPFDIYDGQGKTLVYKMHLDPPRWQGSFSFVPEFSISLNSDLYLFKNGQIYKANDTASDCNYFGVQYDPKIMVVANKEPLVPKVFENTNINCNNAPYLSYFMTEYPYTQITDLMDYEYEQKEGQWYAAIRRNKIQPNQSGMDLLGINTAEKMRALYMMCMYQWKTVAGKKINVKFLSIGYTNSLGHTG